jgi:5'-phosphate synthase pdxT subunit
VTGIGDSVEEMTRMKIGVVAVQGAFQEHERIFRDLGADTVFVRLPKHLDGVDGLVFPGGESTSIGRLMRDYDLLEPIRQLGREGLPMLGTCAGMILLAKHIEGEPEPHLGLMDVTVVRNSFGRQRESFETDLDIPVLGKPHFRAVFIRAPHITAVGDGVEVLARYQDRIVGVKQGNLVALSFHPELTNDYRVHKYFLSLVEAHRAQHVR